MPQSGRDRSCKHPRAYGSKNDFVREFRGKAVALDKAYVDRGLQELCRRNGIAYSPVKRENMIKDGRDREMNEWLKRIRKKIETRISQVMWYGLRFVRAVSRKGTAIKILLALLTFNMYRILG